MRKKRGFQTMRFLVSVIALIGFAGLVSTVARAEEKFPSRPVEVIVPTAQGGGTDLTMRVIAEAVGPFLGQKMVVINKPGGGGTVGIASLAKSEPDGYTIGIVWASVLTMTPHVSKVDFKLGDLSYITQLMESPIVWCVNADFPAKDAKELFEYAKSRPDQITYGCDGIGAFVHFYSERIFKAMNVKLRPIPFDSAGEYLKALLGRHIDMYGGSVGTVMPHAKAGKVRCLFTCTLEDFSELPGTVGVGTLGHPEIAAVNWRGIVAPKGLPEDRRMILEKALHKAAQTEMVKNRFKEWGDKVVTSSGKEFEGLVRSYYNAFGIIAKDLGLSK